MSMSEIDEEKLTKLLVKWMKYRIKTYNPYPIRWKQFCNLFLNSDDPPPWWKDKI